MVAFSVYKSSTYLFDCVGITDDVRAQPYPVVKLEVLDALRTNAVNVVKRIDYAEVDKLIAFCRQHPPQTIVMPATHGDISAFNKFVKYLRARRRAGVAVLTDGRLLILAPVENEDLQLRCVVVHAKPSEDISGHEPSPCETKAESHKAEPPRLPESCDEEDQGNKKMELDEKKEYTAHPPLSYKQMQKIQDERDEVIAASTDLEMLYNLPRLERVTRMTQLRQEYEAFNMHHYDILEQWIESQSDQ
ncbi:hypothetical protein PsorP6_005490 [Peronosclerospora sorghi]|uniref:Uncharacterized protein n=1 Tax=Peronosclerospora sorghi TaxID=230839 RepID=A0ACC0W2F2_9STRA|nr:hypothetical protein PsorP6_005490 [Peronosclerospora sorghi]